MRKDDGSGVRGNIVIRVRVKRREKHEKRLD
jgi:hypothetical protein